MRESKGVTRQRENTWKKVHVHCSGGLKRNSTDSLAEYNMEKIT